MPAIRLVIGDPASVDTDVLVVPVFEGEAPSQALPGLDAASGGEIARAVSAGEVRGKIYEFFITPAANGWHAGRVAVTGAGKAPEFTTERLRKLATAAGVQARSRRVARLAFVVRGQAPAVEAVQAVAEGLILATFSGDQYKSADRLGPATAELVVVVPEPAGSSR